VYLSPPGQVHKNWVLFPKKINGSFAIFHGLMFRDRTRTQMAYLDTLHKDPSPYIESDARFRDEEWYRDVWDSRIRAAGPPPIETNKGWLVLYHANDAHEPHRYKIGAMLLDLFNPEKVLARSLVPVLSPDAWYENHAKPGIVYACGATTDGDTLRVYYGGSDNVVCTATASLSKLLRELVPV
ncbi:glycosidase, partial [Candidatus Parcubacteria bacterium]|nr:glycosidase [Candidatus Parcubacteria bacterium]